MDISLMARRRKKRVRLTEMEQDKILKVIGKRDSARSGRRIAVYRRVR